jgi:hypothetical protein
VEIWELVARESIRDLVARYNANGDLGRIDALMELFSEDATLEVIGSRLYRGLAEIRGLFEGAAAGASPGAQVDDLPQTRFLRHHTATHQIDVAGRERAVGRCYFVVYTDAGPDHWGRYEDEYRLAAQCWRFQSRRVRVEARVPGGWGDRTNRRLHGV